MKYGSAELWAGTYIDASIKSKNWGDWKEFNEQMDHDFLNKNEVRRALERLEAHKQLGDTAAMFFLKIEQLVSTAEMDL